MPNPRSPDLAVVVPATDSPATLERCLAALRASSEPADELIVVEAPSGEGPAAARNRGVARAHGGVVAFVDADVAVHPDALARLRAAFAADPALDAVFGAYDDAPSAPGSVSRFRNLLHHHVHANSAGEAQTFWAGLGAMRREAFLAAGGFDAGRYPHPAVEDIELGMRLRRDGARIVLDPEILGTHLKRWSLRSMARTDFARRGVPWTRLQLEAGSASGALNLSAAHRASALASVALAGGLLARRRLAAAVALATLVGLNRSFYRLLARRGGPRLLAAGVPLHVLHHLLAAAAVPVGVVAHALGRAR
jgi:GT2 family glycosyltransferase